MDGETNGYYCFLCCCDTVMMIFFCCAPGHSTTMSCPARPLTHRLKFPPVLANNNILLDNYHTTQLNPTPPPTMNSSDHDYDDTSERRTDRSIASTASSSIPTRRMRSISPGPSTSRNEPTGGGNNGGSSAKSSGDPDYMDVHELAKGWKAALAWALDPATRGDARKKNDRGNLPLHSAASFRAPVEVIGALVLWGAAVALWNFVTIPFVRSFVHCFPRE
mmetsp:Transcript_32364/g.65811  ORF Transcript_32364/g.65811 Transcript_32364/m.65811 type:complete len:220 (+) Transcript_32364:55-714(+)